MQPKPPLPDLPPTTAPDAGRRYKSRSGGTTYVVALDGSIRREWPKERGKAARRRERRERRERRMEEGR